MNNVLTSKLHREKLQYKIQWTSYNRNNTWYSVRNFKDSSHRIRVFHETKSKISRSSRKLKK